MPIFTRVAFNPTQNIQTVFILFVIKYKKTTAETDKQVRIKTHPLQRKTVPTTIFEDKEEEKKKRKKILLSKTGRLEDRNMYFIKKKIRSERRSKTT